LALTRPEFTYEDALTEADEVIATLDEIGDHAGLADAWQFVSLFDFWMGRCGGAEVAFERSLEESRRGGVEPRVPWWPLAAAFFGPTPVADARRRLVALAEQSNGDRYIESLALIQQGVFAAMEGRFDDARTLRDLGKQTMLDLGLLLHLAGTAQLLGQIERLAGDEPAAERAYREGYDTSVRLGETGYRSTTACDLGEAACAQGRHDEAFRLSEEGEELGAPDDVVTQCRWRLLRAKLLGLNGRFDEAEQLARDALDAIRATDYLNDIADAHFRLAEMLELAEKGGEARTSFEDAVRLYTQKGNVVSADRARERLAGLERQ